MEKTYQHHDHEKTIYQLWEAARAFQPTSPEKAGAKTFTIVMPPPNANDPLHVGHAMFVALEDILIRYHRMLGERALWVPGTDHAGIETQFVFEKKLKKEGKSRFQFDRQTLYQMIWDYVQENSSIATDQLRKLGASADWSRFVFMLEPRLIQIVLSTFLDLYQKKLVYRDYRLVNYCTKCGTAFSELEVKHIEETTNLYYLKYGPFTIATVRPETKFRDTALAVHPQDPRYKEWLGKTLDIPGLLGPIAMTVVADEGVDREFGTGIMKVTPAHDQHDFELGQKYNLPVTPIIDFQGRMDFSWFLSQPNHPAKYRERAERYHGKKVQEARKLIVADLQADGLLVKVNEKYTHTIGVCYRCNTIIEPLPMPQFFVRVAPLVKPVLQALKTKKVRVVGAGHDKVLQHWLKNLKDWNISRQIVWGIRMPVWYSVRKNPDILVHFLTTTGERKSDLIGKLLQTHSLAEITTGLQELRAPIGTEFVCAIESPGEEFIQETDTFDTWFSSAQWPFSTLQSLDERDGSRLFSEFYPTSVMETGYDILPFWVMRMLLIGMFRTNQVPFHTVYLHGLVRDQKGQKMSKSKGNVVNPLTVIDAFGADALRLALVIRSSAGLDKSVGEGDFKAMRNFTNKIWNAARFLVLLQEKSLSGETKTMSPTPQATQAFHQKLHSVQAEITQQLNDYKIGLAAETAYNEFWHWFCDECIEQAKTGKLSITDATFGLQTFLRLLHPFVPFVTEAVWQELRQTERFAEHFSTPLLITTPWPTKV